MLSPQGGQAKPNAFANFASISNVDNEVTWSLNGSGNTFNDFYGSSEFKSVGLYKPMGANDDTPLGKNAYNYSMSSATAIRGIAFANGGRGFVENPLAKPYNIVDNSYELGRTITNNDFNDIINLTKVEKSTVTTPDRVEIKPIEYNTYQMADILKETKSAQVIEFVPIKRELALEKPSALRAFWGNQKEFFRNLKNIFAKSKVK